MRKLNFTKKLKLTKKIVTALNNNQASRIIGGDAPTYGFDCTDALCATQNYINGKCDTLDGGVTDDGCPESNNGCPESQDGWCFSQMDCTHGDCSGTCPYTHGDLSCPGHPCV